MSLLPARVCLIVDPGGRGRGPASGHQANQARARGCLSLSVNYPSRTSEMHMSATGRK